MKAQDRHRLKTNELAETLTELPQYLKEHGPKMITGIVLVLAVITAIFWWRSSSVQADNQRSVLLQSLLGHGNTIQRAAALTAQSGADPAAGTLEGYQSQATILNTSLAELARQGQGSGVGRSALLQQARVLRSQLFFSISPVSADEKGQILGQVEGLYQQVLREHPDDLAATGTAQMGLALVAEDRGEWDKAKGIYEGLVAEAEGKWAGAIFPEQARQRLKILDDIQTTITFPDVAAAPGGVETIDWGLPAGDTGLPLNLSAPEPAGIDEPVEADVGAPIEVETDEPETIEAAPAETEEGDDASAEPATETDGSEL